MSSWEMVISFSLMLFLCATLSAHAWNALHSSEASWQQAVMQSRYRDSLSAHA